MRNNEMNIWKENHMDLDWFVDCVDGGQVWEVYPAVSPAGCSSVHANRDQDLSILKVL